MIVALAPVQDGMPLWLGLPLAAAGFIAWGIIVLVESVKKP